MAPQPSYLDIEQLRGLTELLVLVGVIPYTGLPRMGFTLLELEPELDFPDCWQATGENVGYKSWQKSRNNIHQRLGWWNSQGRLS